MKTFDPSKDTLLISSQKKMLHHRGFNLMVRVEKYKIAGPVHVVGVSLPNLDGSPRDVTIERDQNRAAAMRRIKSHIDTYLDTKLKRSLAQLDAGQGVERDLLDDGDLVVAEGTTGETAEHFCHAVDEHLAASLRTDDPMKEVILDDEERAGYIEGRF